MRWIKREPVTKPNGDEPLIEQLAKIRGIEDINKWLYPSEDFWVNPYLLENMDEAVQRIVKAIHTNENITIMADVDADGIFSCALLYNYLQECMDENKLTYIHAQRSSGHGLETVMEESDNDTEGVVIPIPSETDLLIIVDSSSNSVKECKAIKEEFGLDIVIIDHHEMDKQNDYALIVNCQKGEYPNKSLSGSAMTLKVCAVLDEYLGMELSEQFYDLACIGLISDMMNVDVEENRYIIHRGLKSIRNLGLYALFKRSNVNMYYGVSVTDIGFKITPVVNACTRYDKIELALELFTTHDEERIKELAKQMVKLNDQRKEEEATIVSEAIEKVDTSHSVAILIDDEIGSGFRGLIATQLATKLDKCTFVLKYHEETDSYHGSARAIKNIDLKHLVEVTGDFQYAQGHSKAFGLGIEKKKLKQALTALDEMLEDYDDDDEFVYYDMELNAEDITEELIKEAEKFNRITGMNCPKAMFLVRGLIVEDRELLGKKKKETVKIVCENELSLMKFKVNEEYASDIKNALLDDDNFLVEVEVVGELNLNEWYNFGKKQVIKNNQIFIKDYRLVSDDDV